MQHGWHQCDIRPMSVAAERIEEEFADGVLSALRLDMGWQQAVLAVLAADAEDTPDHTREIQRTDAPWRTCGSSTSGAR